MNFIARLFGYVRPNPNHDLFWVDKATVEGKEGRFTCICEYGDIEFEVSTHALMRNVYSVAAMLYSQKENISPLQFVFSRKSNNFNELLTFGVAPANGVYMRRVDKLVEQTTKGIPSQLAHSFKEAYSLLERVSKGEVDIGAFDILEQARVYKCFSDEIEKHSKENETVRKRSFAFSWIQTLYKNVLMNILSHPSRATYARSLCERLIVHIKGYDLHVITLNYLGYPSPLPQRPA